MDSLLNQCILCKNKNNLKHLQKDYIVGLNDIENYSDMIHDCFNIHLNVSVQKFTVKICQECIKILKQCCMFRMKIKHSQKRLHTQEQMIRKQLSQCNFNILTGMKDKFPKHRNVVKDSHKTAYDERTTLSLNTKPSEALKLHHQKDQKLKGSNHSIVNLKKYLEGSNIRRQSYISNIKPFVISRPAICNQSTNIVLNNDKSPESTISLKVHESNYKSEDEWSTNSEEMKRATGYIQELEMCRRPSFVIPEANFDSLECPICSEIYLNRRGLIVHYYKHFPNYVCEICGISFRTKRNFTQHIEAHQGVPKKPFLAICKICNHESYSLGTYHYHRKMFHTKINLKQCSECPMAFKHNITLNHHLVNVHGKKFKSFPCTMCDKIFYSSFLLQRHIRLSHHKLKYFTCSYCLKEFGAKNDLKSHMLIHTGVKEYKCEFCNKEFLRKKNFKEHLKIHYNIKNYKCDLCEKAFVQKSALKGHIGTHYKK